MSSQEINCTTHSSYVHTGAELLKLKIEKLPCLIEPILQQVGLAAITGSSDTSKSSLLRDLAIAISTKQEQYLGWEICAKHNSVIYVSTEDDQYSIAFLLSKQNVDKQIAEDNYNSLRYIFDTENLLQKLEEELERQPADLIVIDAFADLYTGSPNESNQVRSFLNQFNQLAQKHECLIMWLHHTGKRTDTVAPSKHNVLGSQGFEAKMRVVIELRKDKEDSFLRHFCIVKGNYLKEEYKNQSFVLNFSENMTFSNTGKRVPIEQLCQNNEKSAKIAQAKELKQQGKNQIEIAKELNVDKSTVSRWLKESK